MIIENSRTLGRTLLFTVTPEKGDQDVSVICDSCLLRPNGCSNETTKNRSISARVNLDSTGVKLLAKYNLSVNCGASPEIKFKA